MKKTIGQCLEKYREELGLELKQAIALTNFEVSGPNLGRIERGQVANPGCLTVEKILKAYDKTFIDLFNDMEGSVDEKQINAVPLYERKGEVPLVNWEDITKYLAGESVEITKYITADITLNKGVFATTITNDLMDAPSGFSYPQGSIVIFDPTRTFKNNKDILLIKDGNLKFYRVSKTGDIHYLKALNPSFQSEQQEGELTTLAIAIECRMQVK